MNATGAVQPFLVCHSAARRCGFPLQHVVEIMRALPIEALPVVPGAPRYVTGLSMIRGAMVPVVNLALLLDSAAGEPATRYVAIRLDSRLVAFAVDGVSGVEQMTIDTIDRLPRLLGNTEQSVLAALARLDAELFLVLEAARVIPETLWQELELQEQVR